MAERELTTKQELFVSAYLGPANGNATEAARMAGYKTPHPEGFRLLRNPTIAARVKEHLNKYAGTADDVLSELARVGFAPVDEYVEVLSRDKHGNPVKVKMDLTNKVKALELLGKYHQVFVERQQLDINIREHRVIGIAQAELDAMFQPADHMKSLDA